MVVDAEKRALAPTTTDEALLLRIVCIADQTSELAVLADTHDELLPALLGDRATRIMQYFAECLRVETAMRGP